MLDKKKPSRPGLGRTRTQSSANVQTHSIPIRVGNQVIGQVQGDTFYKSVKASKHFLQKPPAIAFDKSSLKDAEDAGAVRVVITDQETGTIYKATIAQIWRGGFRVNRRFGEQIGLALGAWQVQRKGGLVQLSFLEAAP